MSEIKIYYDKEKKKEVVNSIKFEPVLAGELTKKSLFFENSIEFELGMGIHLTGEGVDIKKTITSLKPGETKEVIFEFDPKLTKLKPIKAKLMVEMDYIVR